MRYDERLRNFPSYGLNYDIIRISPPRFFSNIVRIMDRTTVSDSRLVIKDDRYYQKKICAKEVYFEKFGDELYAFSKPYYKEKMKHFAKLCKKSNFPYDDWPAIVRGWLESRKSK